jgi:cytochrome c oxidase subunit 2
MMQPAPGDNRPSASTIIAVTLIVILGIITIIAAITVFQLPDPVTSQGEDINLLYQPVLIISFIVFWGVTSGIIWAIFRYQRKSADEMPVQIHGSSTLEMTWTVIPILILVGLFIPAVILLVDLKTQPSEDEADVVVEAIGHQWWWEFVYPDDGIRVQPTPPNYEELVPPRLVVPIDQTVLVRVRSTDVVHSFYFPNSLYKIQAIPGNVNEMHFKAEKAGTYTGQCYQFCGTRHADMLFVVEVMEAADYQRWLSETRQAQGIDKPANELATTAGD